GLPPALPLLPVVPFLSHSARDVTDVSSGQRAGHTAAHHFESVFEWPVQLVAFLFGFANAGVLIRGFGTGTWALLTASLAGRPLGMLAAAAVAVAAGLELPLRVSWRDLIVVALASSPSLAFGVFFAAAVFPDGPLLTELKIG